MENKGIILILVFICLLFTIFVVVYSTDNIFRLVEVEEGLTSNNPADIPTWEQEKIQNLRCPAPLLPSYASPKINATNSTISNQQSEIASLEQQIADIMARYKINFSIGTVSYFTSNASNVMPIVDISGTIPNPTLSFTLLLPSPGPAGPQGQPGPIGTPGISGSHGFVGLTGYWGPEGTDTL